MAFQGWEALSGVRAAFPDSRTALHGLLAGIGSFVVGFVLTYVIEARRVSSPMRPLVEYHHVGIDWGSELTVGPDGPLPGASQFAAWQYLYLHGAEFGRFVRSTGTGLDSTGPVTLAPPATPLLAFVPAVLLLAAGWAVVSRCGAGDPWTAARRGGAVALGYLPLVALLALTSQWTAPESVALESYHLSGGLTIEEPEPVGTMGVAALPAALVAGLAYPAAFGSVGGCLAFLRSRGTWPTDAITHSALAGGVAFLIGWGIAVARGFTRAGRSERWRVHLLQGRLSEIGTISFDPGPLQEGTWQFHWIHGADVAIRYSEAVTDGIASVRFPALRLRGIEYDPLVVPVAVALVVAGAVIAGQAPTPGRRGAAVRGATVALGYLPLSLLTAVAVTEPTTGAIRAVVGISLADALVMTGLAFPVVFGAIGGVAAHRIGLIARDQFPYLRRAGAENRGRET